ncbi:hypothetical protein MASR2M18_17950 [Ignavibacteria bacterium]|nr:hypothetical protein [Bacteroidota bacterium]MCZ2133646.1 hypothetical protein [Bacteroidota bacterium]
MMLLTRFFLLAAIIVAGFAPQQLRAADDDSTALAQLKTIDPLLLPYFPRWKVTEPNLQLQILQTFILDGRKRTNLDLQNITVTSAPIKDKNDPEFIILLIECGIEKMVASEVQTKMRALAGTLSDPKRPYSYRDIPPDQPPTESQIDAITNYLDKPVNVIHSFSISAFEQTLKMGETQFWLRSIIGTEDVGYTFLTPGEGKILLERPLYPNDDQSTNRAIQSLINFRIGMGYRFSDVDNGLLDFLPKRTLNSAYGGKGIFGFDMHAPFQPEFGVSFNVESPLKSLDKTTTPLESRTQVDPLTYARYDKTVRNDRDTRDTTVSVAPILRSTGHVALFYHWWLDPQRPENYLRFDVGMNYAEIQEVRYGDGFLAADAKGMELYHPTKFLDWVFARVEYRSQGTYPFGVSMQYSNQILLGRGYLPILGQWLYIDARCSIPLRKNDESRAFENNIFMISPVLRLNF